MDHIDHHCFVLNSSLSLCNLQVEIKNLYQEEHEISLINPSELEGVYQGFFAIAKSVEFYHQLKRCGYDIMRFRSSGYPIPSKDQVFDPFRLKNSDPELPEMVEEVEHYTTSLPYYQGTTLEFYQPGVVPFLLVSLRYYFHREPEEYTLSPGIIVPKEVKFSPGE